MELKLSNLETNFTAISVEATMARYISKVNRIDVKAVPATQRPIKEARSVEQSDRLRKPRETVSAAGVFKSTKSNAREKKYRRRREPTPEPDLLLDLKGISEPQSLHRRDADHPSQMASIQLVPPC